MVVIIVLNLFLFKSKEKEVGEKGGEEREKNFSYRSSCYLVEKERAQQAKAPVTR